jgi:hypothetical protein
MQTECLLPLSLSQVCASKVHGLFYVKSGFVLRRAGGFMYCDLQAISVCDVPDIPPRSEMFKNC